MTQSTRSVSSDRTIRPSDSSSLKVSAADLSNEEISTSSFSSLDYTSKSSSPILENLQPKPQIKEKYSLYPTLPNKISNSHRHCQQHQHNQAEKRRSDKTIVDVIESYGCETDSISHNQTKRCAGAAAGITAASKKPSTIKIVNVPAGDVTFSTTRQVTPPPSDDDDTDAGDDMRNWKVNPKNGPLPNLAESSAAYVSKPQWQPKPSSDPKDPLPTHNYPSIKVMEKNGIKIRTYPMRKDSLESKYVSSPLSPLSSPLTPTSPQPPCTENPQQLAPQRYMPYSPLATNTSSFNAADSKYHHDYQGQPSNISPASTCPPSYTTATRRPATPLDPVTPRSAVWRASRSLQQHVSVWENYDDDDDDGDADFDSEGERRGLIGRVKGRMMSKSLVFGKRCALRSENDGKSKSKSIDFGRRRDDSKERNGKGSSEPKRRFGRWGCGYF